MLGILLLLSMSCRQSGMNLTRGLPVLFSQAPHLPREPHATTIRVADGSPALLHQDLLAVPTLRHERTIVNLLF